MKPDASVMIPSQRAGTSHPHNPDNSSDSPDILRPRSTKPWHVEVDSELRNYLVQKLFKQYFLSKPDKVSATANQTMKILKLARHVEGMKYEKANSRIEYLHLLAKEIHKIRKILEEKRRHGHTPANNPKNTSSNSNISRPATHMGNQGIGTPVTNVIVSSENRGRMNRWMFRKNNSVIVQGSFFAAAGGNPGLRKMKKDSLFVQFPPNGVSSDPSDDMKREGSLWEKLTNCMEEFKKKEFKSKSKTLREEMKNKQKTSNIKANEMVEAQRNRLEDEGKHQIPMPHKREEVFWEKIANFVEVKKKEFKSLKGGLREEMIEFIRTLEIEKIEQKTSNIKIATKLKMNTYKESPVLKTGSFSDPPDLKTGSFSDPPDLKTGSFSNPPDLKTGSFSDPPDLKTGSFSDPPDLPINLKENFLIEKYKSFTIELKAEAAGEFEIPRNLSTTSTSPQQYQKGIYVYDDKHFQRYCPIDGSVTNLKSPPGRGPQFLVNNEKIWMFAGDSVYAYDPLKNQWTKRLISYVKSGAVKVLCGIEYCWFEGVIHAIVRSRHGRSRTMAGLWQGRTMETITVFCLSRSNNWVEKKSTVSVSSPMRKSHTTACGDSIYLFQFGTKRIYRYRPADDQWNTISFPSDLRLSVFVAYKTKLLFHCHKDDEKCRKDDEKCRKDDEKCRKDDEKCRKDDDDKYHDNMVVYDTTTTKFNEYYYPSAIKPSRFTLCNDSIYLLSLYPSSVDRDKSGLCIHQVYKLDLKFLDEATAAPVLSPAPDLTTKISYIWNAVSI